jgi:hypothetical protein
MRSPSYLRARMCVYPFQISSRLTGFQEISYEPYSIGVQNNPVLYNILQLEITSFLTRDISAI